MHFPPLRHTIPGLIFIPGLALAVTLHVMLLHRNEERAREEVLNLARKQASRLAGLMAKAAGSHDKEQINNTLHNFSEDADMKYAVVVDARDTILTSLRELWVSRPLESTAAGDALDLVATTRATRTPQTLVIAGKDLVIAASPVTGQGGDNAPSVGLVERDLSNADEEARKHALRDALAADLVILGFCLLVWGALGAAIVPRARRTLEAARVVGHNPTPAPPVGGNDEFAKIGEAVHQAHLQILDQSRGIRERDERFLRLMELLPSMVFIMREDRIEYMNKSGLDMLGAGSAELVVGRSPFDIIHPDSQAAMSERMRGLLRTGAASTESEETLLRLDGTSLDTACAAAAFRDDRGEAIQVVARDISEKKAGEARRMALSRDLEEKNKELEAIVYAASHDLRSPLLNVMGFSRQLAGACHEIETVLSDSAAPADTGPLKPLVGTTVPRALRFIEQGVAKMDALISGFLQYSRSGRQEIDARDLDMNALVRSTAESLTFQIQQSGADLRLEILPPCRGDAMQIAQVFTNLLDNAMKYHKPGAPCIISVQGHLEGVNSVYTVADNGIGIAPEHQQRIFDIFHRLDPAGSAGEGLGLTIARRIVQRHGGSLSVESQPGAGSTFTVTLPFPA